MARILWVACAEPGSLFPAVPIALELASRGHRLTALCEAASRTTFESLGLAFRPTVELDRHRAGFDAAAHGGGRAARLAWHAGYVGALFADTRRELGAGRYDGVLVDPLEPGAGFAAEAAGVPSASYVHWRMSETGADIPFSFRYWDGERPAAEAFVDWWNAQRALVALGAEPRPVDEHRWYRSSPALSLVLGLPELVDRPGPLPRYARRVGPTVWDPPLAGPPPAWVDGLGRERPAILASVSTVGPADGALLSAVAEAVAGEDLDVVATVTGAADSPPLPRLPSNVRVAPFLSHGMLLPRVSAVVSHAGNGTVTRAACAGVPLLLLPEGKDQFEVARGAVAAGIALALDRTGPDGAHVRESLRTLLEDARYRDRARAIAAAAARRDAPTVAADAVEELLAS